MDLDKIKEILNSRPKSGAAKEESGPNYNWFRIPRSGEIKLRFLPPTPQSGVPGKIVYKHYNIPEKGNINCAKTWKMECPLCKMLEELKYKFEESTLEPFKCIARAYHNVLVLGGSGSNAYDTTTNKPADPKTPYILASSEFNFYWLLERISDPDTGDITDPRTGSAVVFKRKRDGGPLERNVARAASPIADTDEQIEKILASLPELDNIWRYPDDKYFSAINLVTDTLRHQILTTAEQLVSKPSSAPEDKPEEKPNKASVPGKSGDSVKAPDLTGRVEEINDDTPPIPKAAKPAKPADAPDCYGKHTPDAEKCSLCICELDCQEAS